MKNIQKAFVVECDPALAYSLLASGGILVGAIGQEVGFGIDTAPKVALATFKSAFLFGLRVYPDGRLAFPSGGFYRTCNPKSDSDWPVIGLTLRKNLVQRIDALIRHFEPEHIATHTHDDIRRQSHVSISAQQADPCGNIGIESSYDALPNPPGKSRIPEFVFEINVDLGIQQVRRRRTVSEDGVSQVVFIVGGKRFLFGDENDFSEF